MDIKKLAENVIERAETFKRSSPDNGLNSFWEEFKQEAQSGDFKYYESYADKIDAMVHQEIDQMLEEDHGIIKGTSEYSLYERDFIFSAVWRYIQEKAESEGIIYTKPEIGKTEAEESAVLLDNQRSEKESPIIRSGSYSADGKVVVRETEPFLSAVRIDGVWSWGYFNTDDLKDNFKPLREGKDDILLDGLIKEARSALSGIPCPEFLEAK